MLQIKIFISIERHEQFELNNQKNVTNYNTKSYTKAVLHLLSEKYIFGKTTGVVKLTPLPAFLE